MIIVISTLFCIMPFFSLPFVVFGFLSSEKLSHKKIYAMCMAIAVSILLYYFIPDITKDLHRYYIIMKKLSVMEISEFGAYLASKMEPLSNIYFYIFAKIGNYNLIIVVTTLISYCILFCVLWEHQKDINLSNIDFNIVFIFMVSTFYLVDDITGIRFCIARLIFYLALYFDLYKENKKIYIKLLYIVSTLIHSSCIIFLLIRILFSFTKNKFNIKTFFALFLVSISPNILIKLANVTSKIYFFSTLSQKAEEYLSLNAGLYPMFILQLVIMMLAFILLLYTRKRNEQSNSNYINYILIILSIGLLFYQCTSISTRFIRAAIVFSIPILMDFLKEIKVKNKPMVYMVILAISIISLAFQLSHLTVKISYGNLFEEGIFKNIISIFFKKL